MRHVPQSIPMSTVGRTRKGAARSLATGTVLAVLGALLTVLGAPAAEADDWLVRPASGVFAVQGHGEGHGRGMSQYGAQGAATMGRTSAQILDFYYPGTVATQLPLTTQLRVWISGDTDNTTEVVYAADLVVKDDGTGTTIALPANAQRVRALPSGSGFQLQVRINGQWGDVPGLTPSTVGGPVSFQASATGIVQLSVPAGLIGYRGITRAVRSGSNSLTVNTVSIDDYVRDVVPRESIPSWLPAALQSQAVAARSFGYVSIADGPTGTYDLCDTSYCQNYGGATLNGASRETVNTDNATLATAGLIRTYNGRVINAQFGSTNGGWTVAGGTPYLIAQADPYEAVANPPQSYANWKGQLTASALESRWSSIGSFTRLRISQRDGNGEWGGRVVSAVIEGTRGSVTATGDQLRQVIDAPIRSTYYQIIDTEAAHLARGSLDSVSVSGSALLVKGWAYDPDVPSSTVAVHVWDTAPNGAQRLTVLAATRARPDINVVFPGAGVSHGFSDAVGTSGRGVHRVCAYAINLGAGSSNTTLGCENVSVGGPFGSADAVSVGVGTMTVNGWSIDADSPGTSIAVAMYDSSAAGAFGYGNYPATASRPDIGAAYPGAGAAHGYRVTVPLTSGGAHDICVYGIAANPDQDNALIGCQSIAVTAPIGSLDVVSSGPGTLTAAGWALDPGQPLATAEVHLYISGPTGSAGYTGTAANTGRADVGAAFPGTGTSHGFGRTVPAQGSGTNRLCAYVIASGPGAGNQLLGCRSIVVP